VSPFLRVADEIMKRVVPDQQAAEGWADWTTRMFWNAMGLVGGRLGFIEDLKFKNQINDIVNNRRAVQDALPGMGLAGAGVVGGMVNEELNKAGMPAPLFDPSKITSTKLSDEIIKQVGLSRATIKLPVRARALGKKIPRGI
jgi:hypothetical protein